MWHAAKRRARLRDTPFDIKREDIVIPTHCPVLGIALKHAEGSCAPDSPTLDCIRPELGYVRGNICVMSRLANGIKQNANSEDVKLVADWMKAKGL